jgi:hypothetical protein
MFLLKALPPSILDRPFFSLWHFNEESQYFYDDHIVPFVWQFRMPQNERISLINTFTSSPRKEWYGIFGPAFGGTMEILRTMWSILNINETNVTPYLGREGLMASERVLAIVCMYMGFKLDYGLNGNIYTHPDVFKTCIIPDYSTLYYPDSYFYKVWKKR